MDNFCKLQIVNLMYGAAESDKDISDQRGELKYKNAEKYRSWPD